MTKADRLVRKPQKGAVKRRPAAYRAVTGAGRDEWEVVDAQGVVIFRGDARAAALIASRLTRPDR